jgi:uncharacterized protein (TIGR02646 family)
MVKLDRARLVPPLDWSSYVTQRLQANAPSFHQEALRFEAHPLGDPIRSGGFAAFAGASLPVLRKTKKGDERGPPPLWQQKKSLKESFAEWAEGLCAYCQCPEMSSGHGEVEHFKPKSLFPTLTYDLDNYFLSCKRCNLAKLDKFPLPHGYLRPDGVDPEALLNFDAEGRVEASPADVAALATVRDLDLNRDWLVRHRKVAIRNAQRALKAVMARTALPLSDRRDLALSLLPEPLTAYSAAVRQVLRATWNEAYPLQAI